MLIYQPLFDTYHCTLRLIRLLMAKPDQSMPVVTLKILDFYLVFPHLLKDIQATRGVASKIKKLPAGGPYKSVPNPTRLFQSAANGQELTIRAMAAVKMLDESALAKGVATLDTNNVPQPLLELAKSRNESEADLLKILVEVASIPVAGTSGLKARTGLIESRYDVV